MEVALTGEGGRLSENYHVALLHTNIREKEKILDKQHKGLNSQCCAHLHHKELVLEMHTEARER